MGIFVVAMATTMSMSSGTAAGACGETHHDEKPADDLDDADELAPSHRAPGMPILANRPTPSASG